MAVAAIATFYLHAVPPEVLIRNQIQVEVISTVAVVVFNR